MPYMVYGMFSAVGFGQRECKCLSEPPVATCSSFSVFMQDIAPSHSKTDKAVL